MPEIISESKPTPPKVEKKASILAEKEVRTYFEDIPELVEVARCESRFRHTDKEGNIFRGIVNNMDVGIMQINEHYHLEDSKELGFDIYTLRGNMAYARYLYEREGITPWSSSHPCWQYKVANLQKDAELKELALNKAN